MTSIHTDESAGKRLDILGLKALETMQKIICLKLKLQEHIKDGSIDLAKSRYILGNRNVSVSQLPTGDSLPFNALRKVEISKTVISDVETSSFTLLLDEPQGKKDERRSQQKESISDSNSLCNPLHWFGVLVPQNLRAAQASFKIAVEISVEIASLQAYLESLRMEFCTLKLEQIKLD